MGDVALSNGSKSADSQMSEQEYRELCKKLRREQMARKGGKRKSKPPLRAIGEVVSKPGNFRIQKMQTDWDALPNYTPFTTDLEATEIFIKIGRERAASFNTMRPFPVASGLVHRVFIGV
jgi:hypothetical protein